jgi:hypothetical protein
MEHGVKDKKTAYCSLLTAHQQKREVHKITSFCNRHKTYGARPKALGLGHNPSFDPFPFLSQSSMLTFMT